MNSERKRDRKHDVIEENNKRMATKRADETEREKRGELLGLEILSSAVEMLQNRTDLQEGDEPSSKPKEHRREEQEEANEAKSS